MKEETFLQRPDWEKSHQTVKTRPGNSTSVVGKSWRKLWLREAQKRHKDDRPLVTAIAGEKIEKEKKEGYPQNEFELSKPSGQGAEILGITNPASSWRSKFSLLMSVPRLVTRGCCSAAKRSRRQ